MLIVSGIIELNPSAREEFLALRKDQVLGTLEEAGCIEYAFSADLVDPGRVRIFEMWEDDAALTAHLGALAGNQTPMPDHFGVTSVTLLRHEVASSGPLGV